MKNSLSGISKAVLVFIIICFFLPVAFAQKVATPAKAATETVTTKTKVTTYKHKHKKVRKYRKINHEVTHGTENDKDLQKIKDEKDKKKGLK